MRGGHCCSFPLEDFILCSPLTEALRWSTFEDMGTALGWHVGLLAVIISVFCSAGFLQNTVPIAVVCSYLEIHPLQTVRSKRFAADSA